MYERLNCFLDSDGYRPSCFGAAMNNHEELHFKTVEILTKLVPVLDCEELSLLCYLCGTSIEDFYSFPAYGGGGKYIAFRDGRIFSKLSNKFLKGRRTNSGYKQVILSGKAVMAHRVIADTFIKGKSKERNEINHKDGDKQNNAVTNLEWCSRSENVKHSYETLNRKPPRTCGKGSENGAAKLSEFQVFAILEATESASDLSQIFNVSVSMIKKIKAGKAWTHITNELMPICGNQYEFSNAAKKENQNEIHNFN